MSGLIEALINGGQYNVKSWEHWQVMKLNVSNIASFIAVPHFMGMTARFSLGSGWNHSSHSPMCETGDVE